MKSSIKKLKVRQLNFNTLQKLFSLEQTPTMIAGPRSIESREQLKR